MTFDEYTYLVDKIDAFLRHCQDEMNGRIRAFAAQEVERVEHQTVEYLRSLLDRGK